MMAESMQSTGQFSSEGAAPLPEEWAKAWRLVGSCLRSAVGAGLVGSCLRSAVGADWSRLFNASHVFFDMAGTVGTGHGEAPHLPQRFGWLFDNGLQHHPPKLGNSH